jgi:hypothetical protein
VSCRCKQHGRPLSCCTTAKRLRLLYYYYIRAYGTCWCPTQAVVFTAVSLLLLQGIHPTQGAYTNIYGYHLRPLAPPHTPHPPAAAGRWGAGCRTPAPAAPASWLWAAQPAAHSSRQQEAAGTSRTGVGEGQRLQQLLLLTAAGGTCLSCSPGCCCIRWGQHGVCNEVHHSFIHWAGLGPVPCCSTAPAAVAHERCCCLYCCCSAPEFCQTMSQRCQRQVGLTYPPFHTHTTLSLARKRPLSTRDPCPPPLPPSPCGRET